MQPEIVKLKRYHGNLIVYGILIIGKIINSNLSDKTSEDETYDRCQYLADVCTRLFPLQGGSFIKKSFDLMRLFFHNGLNFLLELDHQKRSRI